MITTKVEKDKEKKTEKQKLGKEYGTADMRKKKGSRYVRFTKPRTEIWK